jgi:hypothetical protein
MALSKIKIQEVCGFHLSFNSFCIGYHRELEVRICRLFFNALHLVGSMVIFNLVAIAVNGLRFSGNP